LASETEDLYLDSPVLERPVGNVVRFLWWAFAATFIMLGFSPYRLSLRFLGSGIPLNIPVPIAFMIAAAAVGWVTARQRRMIEVTDDMEIRLAKPYGLFYATLLYWFFSAFFASDETLGLRDASKLLGGVLIFAGIVAHLPNDARLLGQIWTIIVWTSAAVFSALIYRYAIVFQAPYLGAVWEAYTRDGRNQLMWFLIFVLPFSITRALAGGRVRLLHVAPLVPLMVAFFYGASRNTWISVAIGVAAVLPFAIRERGRSVPAGAVAGVALVAVVAWFSWTSLAGTIGDVEAGRRFQYLYDPNAVPEYDSYRVRGEMAESAITVWLRSPVFGVGLSSTGMTHSDYPAVLAELGIIGLVLFLAMLGAFLRDLIPLPRDLPTDISWMSFANRAVLIAVLVSLAAINGYNSPTLWAFLGLAYKLRQIEHQHAFGY
jgi:hypothetical protein